MKRNMKIAQHIYRSHLWILRKGGVCYIMEFNQEIDGQYLGENHENTVVYTDPQILKGDKPSTMSDVYSFGITLWQLLARAIPHNGNHLHVVIYQISQVNVQPLYSSLMERVKLGDLEPAAIFRTSLPRLQEHQLALLRRINTRMTEWPTTQEHYSGVLTAYRIASDLN
uniref:Protein kinase domain-containing protein n=1 Tax=Timema poppense TaxID=170557 RepID=A0A7R9CKS2_TIMPO|nr:unnamed protein product [Timema poppensis]